MTPRNPGRGHLPRWLIALCVVSAAAGLHVSDRFTGSDTALGERRPPGFDAPDQAMEWILLAHRDEQGRIPRDGLMRARRQADAMRLQSRQQSLTGESSGSPAATAGITRGGWNWIGPSNIGGRVRALVVQPNGSTILTGGVAGGIWKSTNGGSSWRVIDDFLANLAVSTMVARPGQPHVLLTGTGEGFFNADSIRGAGVFLSTDEGESWSQLSSTTTSDFDYVNRLAFSADGNTLLAATRTGLFRSTDLGGGWIKVLNVANMLDVKFIAGSSALAVASGRNRNAFYSADGGLTWQSSGGLGGGTSSSLRVELAVSVSAPNIVFASLDETSGQIWKSTDSGTTYQKVSDSAHLSTQGWYDNALWIDPTNPDHVVAGGVSLYRSSNGGATFSTIAACHVDQHAIVHDPGYNGTTNRRVYFGSDGGVCKLEDVTVNSVTSLRNGLGITQFYGGGGNASAGRIMGGTQDNGTLLFNLSSGAPVWSSQFGADGGFSAVDPTDPNILYGETQNFRIHRSLTGGTPSQYIYGGSGSMSCSKPVPYQLTDACNGFANFIAPFMLDPNEPNRLLAGGRSLWRSDDPRTPNTATTGPSWAAIKAPTPTSSNISAIAVATGNSDLVWVGHNNGDIYTTTNGTSGTPAWTKVDGSLPNRVVTSIAVSPADPQIVYAAFGGFSPDNLWRTTNAGATWTDVSGAAGNGLADVPVRSVVMHPLITDWLYAATDVGVFASEDGGSSWSLPHEGPANVAVFQLFWLDSTLVAVTHGRGMYTVPATSIVPAFRRRPLSQAVIAGHSVTFNVVAVGAGPFSYQWYRGDRGDTSSPIAGATSPSFNTGPITQTSSYWVRLTSPFGTADSNTATLTLLAWGTLLPGNTVQNPTANAQRAGALTASAKSTAGVASSASPNGVPAPTSRAPVATRAAVRPQAHIAPTPSPRSTGQPAAFAGSAASMPAVTGVSAASGAGGAAFVAPATGQPVRTEAPAGAIQPEDGAAIVLGGEAPIARGTYAPPAAAQPATAQSQPIATGQELSVETSAGGRGGGGQRRTSRAPATPQAVQTEYQPPATPNPAVPDRPATMWAGLLLLALLVVGIAGRVLRSSGSRVLRSSGPKHPRT